MTASWSAPTSRQRSRTLSMLYRIFWDIPFFAYSNALSNGKFSTRRVPRPPGNTSKSDLRCSRQRPTKIHRAELIMTSGIRLPPCQSSGARAQAEFAQLVSSLKQQLTARESQSQDSGAFRWTQPRLPYRGNPPCARSLHAAHRDEVISKINTCTPVT